MSRGRGLVAGILVLLVAGLAGAAWGGPSDRLCDDWTGFVGPQGCCNICGHAKWDCAAAWQGECPCARPTCAPIRCGDCPWLKHPCAERPCGCGACPCQAWDSKPARHGCKRHMHGDGCRYAHTGGCACGGCAHCRAAGCRWASHYESCEAVWLARALKEYGVELATPVPLPERGHRMRGCCH